MEAKTFFCQIHVQISISPAYIHTAIYLHICSRVSYISATLLLDIHNDPVDYDYKTHLYRHIYTSVLFYQSQDRWAYIIIQQ